VSTRPIIEVVGLGPAGAEHVTEHTHRVIASIEHRFLRTRVHPSADVVPDATSFDDLYESASSFDEVYREIVERLVRAALQHGRVLYAVPGSPLVLERSVALLRERTDVELVLHPASSFLDLAWSRLAVDPIEAGVTLVDGHLFASSAAGCLGPFLVAHCHANWVLSEIKLAAGDDARGRNNDDLPVTLLHRLGLPDEQIVTTTWSEIDRTLDADHLTSLWIPRLDVPVGADLVSFHELARTLRRECPWDREQDHRSLLTYLLEEAHEVVDAVLDLDPDDPSTDEHLIEELGDLLYQIEFHAAIAEEQGRFTMADVARGIHDKLVRRHPHVFARDNRDANDSGDTNDSGDANDPTADELVASWEAIKRTERAERGVADEGPFDGISNSTGALSYAATILRRSSKFGLEFRPVESDDLGRALLAMVAECRRLGVDPEVALREAANRWRDEAQVEWTTRTPTDRITKLAP